MSIPDLFIWESSPNFTLVQCVPSLGCLNMGTGKLILANPVIDLHPRLFHVLLIDFSLRQCALSTIPQAT